MRGKLTALIGTIVVVVLAIIGFSSAPAPAKTSPGGAIDQLAQRGFGDYRNGYAWGMAWFKGKLYIGTGREVACVEAQTRAFFLPNLNQYNRNPAGNVRCPADPYDLKLRAEIWSYDPDNGRWARVYRSPAIPNPRAKGKTIGRDIAFRGMTVEKDARGHEVLYVSGVTANEYIPELKKKYPARILHTRDGRDFDATTMPADYKVTTLTGTQVPIGFRSLQVIDGHYYTTASTGLTGDGAIVEVKRPWDGRRASFKQVSPTNVAVFEIQKFHNHLYAGTGDPKYGYSVYRALDRKPKQNRWTVLVNNGAGRGVRLTSVVSMHVFKDQLYVGSSGWLNEERTLPATEVIRVRTDNTWDVVTGAPRVDHGDVKFPVSGLGDGWGTGFAAHPWRMASQDGALYAGTNDYSSTAINQGYPLVQAMLAGEYGFDVWASCDGTYWFPITRDAFGANPFDFGARTMVATPEGLAVGSADHALGTAVYIKRLGACSAGIKTGRSTKSVQPRSLLADPQRNGNVVSWNGAAGTTYRVLRAEQPEVTLSVKGPALMPNGFATEDATPEIVPPGTAGSHEVAMMGYGQFYSVGSTKSGVWVDKDAVAGMKYAYRVEAVDSAGRTLGSSGVQVVPSPSPALTVGAVKREIGEQTGSAFASGGPTSIEALRSAAAGDEQLLDQVDRLARTLRYQSLAGGSAAKG